MLWFTQYHRSKTICKLNKYKTCFQKFRASCLYFGRVVSDWWRVLVGTRCLEARCPLFPLIHGKDFDNVYIDTMLPLPNSGLLKSLWSRFDHNSCDLIGRKSQTSLKISIFFFFLGFSLFILPLLFSCLLL